MKVIAVDNFDREDTSDALIAEGLSPEAAKAKVDELNAKGDDYSTWYYRAVPDDHKLFVFDPNS